MVEAGVFEERDAQGGIGREGQQVVRWHRVEEPDPFGEAEAPGLRFQARAEGAVAEEDERGVRYVLQGVHEGGQAPRLPQVALVQDQGVARRHAGERMQAAGRPDVAARWDVVDQAGARDAVHARHVLGNGRADGEDGVGTADVPPLDALPEAPYPGTSGRGGDVRVALAGVVGEAGSVPPGGRRQRRQRVQIAGVIDAGRTGQRLTPEQPVHPCEEGRSGARRMREHLQVQTRLEGHRRAGRSQAEHLHTGTQPGEQTQLLQRTTVTAHIARQGKNDVDGRDHGQGRGTKNALPTLDRRRMF